jgi:hypothetical protein
MKQQMLIFPKPGIACDTLMTLLLEIIAVEA